MHNQVEYQYSDWSDRPDFWVDSPTQMAYILAGMESSISMVNSKLYPPGFLWSLQAFRTSNLANVMVRIKPEAVRANKTIKAVNEIHLGGGITTFEYKAFKKLYMNATLKIDRVGQLYGLREYLRIIQEVHNDEDPTKFYRHD